MAGGADTQRCPADIDAVDQKCAGRHIFAGFLFADLLFEHFADGLMVALESSAIPRRDRIPPRIQRPTVAAQFHAHAVGEPDPVREAMAGHGDHDRDIGTQGALDQIGKAFALALLPSEPVHDHQICPLIDGAGDLRPGIQQLADI